MVSTLFVSVSDAALTCEDAPARALPDTSPMTTSEPQRLSRRIVEMTGCSRREAELYIEGGWVSVDGVVVEAPQFKVADQQVVLAPDARAEPVLPVTLLWNKPAGTPVQNGDMDRVLDPALRHVEHTDPVVRPLFRHLLRLEAPLALDSADCGLQVLTQAYGVRRKLGDRDRPVEQEFVVEFEGDLPPTALAALNSPWGSGRFACKVSRQSEQRLRVAGKGFSSAQVRERCLKQGIAVRVVRRLRIGQIALSGLDAGQWRYLPEYKRF